VSPYDPPTPPCAIDRVQIVAFCCRSVSIARSNSCFVNTVMSFTFRIVPCRWGNVVLLVVAHLGVYHSCIVLTNWRRFGLHHCRPRSFVRRVRWWMFVRGRRHRIRVSRRVSLRLPTESQKGFVCMGGAPCVAAVFCPLAWVPF